MPPIRRQQHDGASGEPEAEASPNAVLEFRGVSKRFPGQLAVNNVSFSVMPGEVHALVGENGAGKSTLIKVLAGHYRADSGEILLDGEPVELAHPSEATRLGLGFIHQVPALVGTLSITENTVLGLDYARGPGRFISWRRQHTEARKVLDLVGLSDLPVRRRLEQASLAEQQLVGVARVLAWKPRVIVFDEVTAPLNEGDVRRLFRIINALRADGVAMIYVSHRLEEIFEVADRVTVMKDARYVATESVASIDQKTLTRLIVGKDPAEWFEETDAQVGTNPILSVRNLSDDILTGVSFDVFQGELLGLAGLGGSGRTNIVESVFGARTPQSGEILLDGEVLKLRRPTDAVRSGIGLVTEDRIRYGFIPNFPIWQNVTLPWLRQFSRRGVLELGRERAAGGEAMKRFDIRAASIRSPVRDLSGGNQQKTVLAKWLSQQLRLLLLDEPTHGVDIGAKEEIYSIIRQIAESGVAVVLISSELEELEGLCGRVLVLREGSITAELRAANVTKQHMLEALFEETAGRRA